MLRQTKIKIGARLVGALLAAVLGTVTYNEGDGIGADGVARMYYDSVGVPTICSGSTSGVTRGLVLTPDQCKARTKKEVLEHAQALEGWPVDAPDYAILAGIDFSYNVGAGAAKNSTAFKLARAGDYPGAGKAILNWRYVTDKSKRGKPGYDASGRFDCSQPNNKVCLGLWKRRLWESQTMQGKHGTAQEAVQNLPRY